MTEPPLIEMIVVGLGLAFLFGTLANYLKISPIAGYLLAGVAGEREIARGMIEHAFGAAV
jgi:predicted Kef-type K+ transport protein